MIDGNLNEEFGNLALHLTNEGLDDRNKDIPYFNHEQLTDLLKTTTIPTTLPTPPTSATQHYKFTRARSSIYADNYPCIYNNSVCSCYCTNRRTRTTNHHNELPFPFQDSIDLYNFDAPLERRHRPQGASHHTKSVPTIIPLETPRSRNILVFNVALRHTFNNICVRQYINIQGNHALSLMKMDCKDTTEPQRCLGRFSG